MISVIIRKRGRPKGSRSRVRLVAPGMQVSGSATSAAKLNHAPGFAPVSGQWVYVRGEGFVRWSDIKEQVAEAYLQWRRRKAMQGVLIYDWEEARQNDITGGRAIGPVRSEWLREWRERHALLCERASA